jgi:cytoskeletal protein RodZ
MEPKVILAAVVIVIVLGAILYNTVFKKSEEVEEVEEIEEVEEVEEGESSSDPVDDVMTGGDDEPVPDEDETSLETAPADGEAEDETVNEDVIVEGYTLKK